MGYIYVIKHNNKPVYVGQTIKPIIARWKEHLQTSKRNDARHFIIHKAIKKYGAENFSIEKLEETDNLNDREKWWIKELHTHISENGYNMTYGGETCSETIKTPCYQYDIDGTFLKEFESISEAGRYLGKNNHGNICKVINGQINIAYGYRWSNQKVDRLPPLTTNFTGISKTVYQYDLNGKFIQSFSSTKEAARFLNKSQGNISLAANGKRNSAYGYRWSYEYNGD